MFLQLSKNDGSKPISLRFVKIAAIYGFVFPLLFIIFMDAVYSYEDYARVEFTLTFAGLLYFIESIVLIVLVFILSSRLKKAHISRN
jgi:uncharacterized membrane protein YesL